MAEILTGDCAAVSPASILQLAESEVLTGELRVGSAELRLHAGRVVEASFGRARGVDALLELMLARTGRFVLDAGPVASAEPLGETGPLILEALRLMDEWARIEGLVVRPRGALDPALAPLTRFLDGTRTIGQAVEAAGVLRVQVVDALVDAVERDAVETLAAPVAPPLPVDFDALIDVGRKLAREGHLAEAREAFERAVELRPDDRIAAQNLRRILTLSRS